MPRKAAAAPEGYRGGGRGWGPGSSTQNDIDNQRQRISERHNNAYENASTKELHDTVKQYNLPIGQEGVTSASVRKAMAERNYGNNSMRGANAADQGAYEDDSLSPRSKPVAGGRSLVSPAQAVSRTSPESPDTSWSPGGRKNGSGAGRKFR